MAPAIRLGKNAYVEGVAVPFRSLWSGCSERRLARWKGKQSEPNISECHRDLKNRDCNKDSNAGGIDSRKKPPF